MDRRMNCESATDRPFRSHFGSSIFLFKLLRRTVNSSGNMVRVILAPKGVEHYFIKSVAQGDDGGHMRTVLTPMKYNQCMRSIVTPIRVCLCEDGRREGYPSSAISVKDGLSRLYSLWGMSVDVQICKFSFMHPDQAEMADLLMDADLFFFAGILDVPEGLSAAMRTGILVNLLRERIQYNACAYFGICGGAVQYWLEKRTTSALQGWTSSTA